MIKTIRKLAMYLYNPEERWLSSVTFRSTQYNMILMQSCPIIARRRRFCAFPWVLIGVDEVEVTRKLSMKDSMTGKMMP